MTPATRHPSPLPPSQLAAAETKQAHFTEDLGFLRDQIITVEVNMARLFNHDVKTRRQAGLPAGGGAARVSAGSTAAGARLS